MLEAMVDGQLVQGGSYSPDETLCPASGVIGKRKRNLEARQQHLATHPQIVAALAAALNERGAPGRAGLGENRVRANSFAALAAAESL
jgi:hypothetical protein